MRHRLIALGLAALVAAAVAPPARAQLDFFKDEATTMKVVFKLQFNKALLRETIDVKTNGGIVTLSGNVSAPELAQLAGKLAAETSGVVKVNNLLTVGAGAGGTSR